MIEISREMLQFGCFVGAFTIRSLRFWEKYQTAEQVWKEFQLDLPGKIVLNGMKTCNEL